MYWSTVHVPESSPKDGSRLLVVRQVQSMDGNVPWWWCLWTTKPTTPSACRRLQQWTTQASQRPLPSCRPDDAGPTPVPPGTPPGQLLLLLEVLAASAAAAAWSGRRSSPRDYVYVALSATSSTHLRPPSVPPTTASSPILDRRRRPLHRRLPGCWSVHPSFPSLRPSCEPGTTRPTAPTTPTAPCC